MGSSFGIRHLQCFLLFGGLSVAYALRVNLSVAIVAMTDSQHPNPNHPYVSKLFPLFRLKFNQLMKIALIFNLF